MGAIHAYTRESMAEMQANIGAIHVDTMDSIEAIQADIGAVGAAQMEPRCVLETATLLVGRLRNFACAKFVVRLDLNPSFLAK